MAYSLEALALFRASLRTIRLVPNPARTKLRLNVREMFEIYQGLGEDSPKRTLVIQEGWHDLGVLREVLKAEPHLLAEIFKPFTKMEDKLAPIDASMHGMLGGAVDGTLGGAQVPHADETIEESLLAA